MCVAKPKSIPHCVLLLVCELATINRVNVLFHPLDNYTCVMMIVVDNA